MIGNLAKLSDGVSATLLMSSERTKLQQGVKQGYWVSAMLDSILPNRTAKVRITPVLAHFMLDKILS